MKAILLIFTVCVLSVASVPSQNVAIARLRDRPEHEFNNVEGCPTNWPVIVDRIGTNPISPHPGRQVITEDQLAAIYRNIGPAFTNWHATAWANYNQTNSAAIEARRAQLRAQYEAFLDRVQSATNDITVANATIVLSNIIRLRQLEERLR